MSGHFKVKKITDMSQVTEDSVFPQSDFATMNEKGQFIQMEYIEDETYSDPIIAKPGIFTMIKTMAGLRLEKTEFTQTNILREFVNTQEIVTRVKNFFNRLHVYTTYKVFPKRFLLLYGPPGTGKSVSIADVATEFGDNPDFFVLIWHTDQIEPGQVKDFIKHLEFDGPKYMIIIMEDIGGVEAEGRSRGSESALLSLLDNQEKAFKIPTFGLGTTNYIEQFQGNLTNRPGRFDEKLMVDFPNAEAREKLLKHYDVEGIMTEEVYTKLKSKACDQFTPAQIQELIIRSALNQLDPLHVIDELAKDIKKYDKGFAKDSKGLGLGNN